MNIPDIMKEITFYGDLIKKLRKENGFTQQQLAEKSGISEISIRKYETHERTPKLETIKKLSNALNVPLSTFVSEDVINKDFYRFKDKKLLEHFHNLNDIGKEKAIEQVELLTKIPEYKKDSENQNQK